MSANERDLRVAVVYSCFLERGDFILESLRLGGFTSEAARQLTSFSGQLIKTFTLSAGMCTCDHCSKLTMWKWSLNLKVGRKGSSPLGYIASGMYMN